MLLFIILELINEKDKKLKNTLFSYQEIKDFILIGKSDADYYLYGRRLLNTKNNIFIEPFNLSYTKNNIFLNIKADKGIFFKSVYMRGNSIFSAKKRKKALEKIGNLQLIGSVEARYKNISMFTNMLVIDTRSNIATTHGKAIFISGNTITIGKKAVIYSNKDKIDIYNVKTIINANSGNPKL